MAINTELLIRDNEWFQEWKAMGVAEGKAAMLRRQIIQRFGAIPAWVSDRLDSATSQVLDEWALRILEATTVDRIFQ